MTPPSSAAAPPTAAPPAASPNCSVSPGSVALRLALATHNEGKLAELRAILAPLVPGLDAAQIVSARELNAPEPVETGLSFAANAEIKARALAEASGLPAVADDSGLCVDVLGGAPGIFSARWSGRHGDDAGNLDLLLAQLKEIGDPHRTARFTCAMVLVVPGAGGATVVERSWEGRLAHAPVGSHGFGYDPIFVPAREDSPEGAGRTSAQLSPAEKNAQSHRGRALSALLPALTELLSH